MLQAVEALTRTPSCDRVRQRRTSRTTAVFELDPYAVEDALEGVIVPGFEGSIRATLTDIRSAPVLVMLGAPGVYPDGFKVTNAARTAPLSETEQAQAHALVKARLTAAGIIVARSKQPADHQVKQIHNPASISSTNTASRLLDSTSLSSSKTAMTIMHDSALDLDQEWIVPGFVPTGLTILAGAPKLGKSWLVLQAAVAVARGDLCLGDDEPCTAGDVLYLALEDNDRRLHRRLKTVAQTSDGMDRLHIRSINDDFPSLDRGGMEFLNAWCDHVEAPRLVIIDTLARVRPPAGKGQSAYEADYAVIGSLQKLASERGIAVVVVTHTRKASASEPFDCVSGTLGISGAADATLVMRRKGEKGQVTLYARGRDIEELEVPIQFDAEACKWSVTNGEIGHSDHTGTRSPERAAIIDALMSSTAAAPMTAGDVVTITGFPSANVRKLLSKMVVTGEVSRAGRGRYVVANKPAPGHADTTLAAITDGCGERMQPLESTHPHSPPA